MISTFKKLYDQPLIENVAWAEALIPKSSKVLIGGLAKVGKSFLLINLIEELTKGGKVWGLNEFSVPVPLRVLYVDQEIGLYGLQRRIKNYYEAAGTEPRNSYYLSRVPEMELDRPQGRRMLEDSVEECEAQVVVIDPISQSMWGDDSSNRDVRSLFHELDILLNKFESEGLSIVLCHHFGKPPKQWKDKVEYDPGDKYNFRGASKWIDAPDTLVTCVRTNCEASHGKWCITVDYTFRHDEELPSRELYIQTGGLVTVGQPTIRMI